MEKMPECGQQRTWREQRSGLSGNWFSEQLTWRVLILVEYVLGRTPEMTHPDFVQTINIMCADARKAIRARYHRHLLMQNIQNELTNNDGVVLRK